MVWECLLNLPTITFSPVNPLGKLPVESFVLASIQFLIIDELITY